MSESAPITLEQALACDGAAIRDLYRTHMNEELCGLLEFIGFDRRFVRASGTRVTDEQGREYLDFLGGYGVFNLGHNHPEVIGAIDQVTGMVNMLQASLGVLSAPLASALAAIAPGSLTRTFFSNSGTEAIEGALKLARLATGRRRFLYAENSFHGKTFGALSVTGRRKYQDPFEPLLPGCESVPFNHVEALSRALASQEYAAFIVEPIQGEGGILVPEDGYLKEVEKQCRATGTLFIDDEIQTGFGRTGYMFGCEHDAAEPDIMVVAKALGGGVMPIGAFIASDAIWQRAYGTRDRCLLHTSTFGGNTWACAAGLKSVEILVRDRLAEEAQRKGERFLHELRRLATEYSLVKEVRGRGLMLGLEFYEPRFAKGLSSEYLAGSVSGLLLDDHRIITAYTLNNPNVIRFEPPLNVRDEDLDHVIGALETVFRRHRSFMGVVSGLGAKAVLRRLRR